MKRQSMILVAAMAALLAGCDFFPAIQGSGFLTTSSYGFTGFTTVVATQTCKVRVVRDAAYSVRVTSDDNLGPYLVVRGTSTGALEIGLATGYTYRGITFTAEVHMPVLAGLDASGGSQIRAEPGFSSTLALEVNVSGTSVVDLRSLAYTALNAYVSGASTLTASGVVTAETLSVSGASTADLLACAAGSATVVVSGASEAWTNAGQVTVSASGASTLYYLGTPTIQVNYLTGASRIVRVQ